MITCLKITKYSFTSYFFIFCFYNSSMRIHRHQYIIDIFINIFVKLKPQYFHQYRHFKPCLIYIYLRQTSIDHIIYKYVYGLDFH